MVSDCEQNRTEQGGAGKWQSVVAQHGCNNAILMILGNNFLFLPDLLFILSDMGADTSVAPEQCQWHQWHPYSMVIVHINYLKKLPTDNLASKWL